MSSTIWEPERPCVLGQEAGVQWQQSLLNYSPHANFSMKLLIYTRDFTSHFPSYLHLISPKPNMSHLEVPTCNWSLPGNGKALMSPPAPRTTEIFTSCVPISETNAKIALSSFHKLSSIFFNCSSYRLYLPLVSNTNVCISEN